MNMLPYASARRRSTKRTDRPAGESRFSTMVPRSRNAFRSRSAGMMPSPRTMQNCESAAESTGLNGFSSNVANSVAR